MQDRSSLLSERRLPESMQLDSMSVSDAIALMNSQDAIALKAVALVANDVARAIELVVESFRNGGRLFYVGAGTSGRLGVLDASECPPTFRTDPAMVQGIIAGGESAMFRAKEGAEDSRAGGADAIDEKSVSENDVVMGIAAGGTTPFVHGALERAIAIGAKTIFLSCVQPVANEPNVAVTIRPLVGPEVLTGSTRLKAGTATKLVLNQITTIAMVRLGKCYQNLMVDMCATNAKLVDRATRMVSMVTGVKGVEAKLLLDRADGHVKVAVVMKVKEVDATEAKMLLDAHDGSLSAALR